jgi:hypothetical protein
MRVRVGGCSVFAVKRFDSIFANEAEGEESRGLVEGDLRAENEDWVVFVDQNIHRRRSEDEGKDRRVLRSWSAIECERKDLRLEIVRGRQKQGGESN